jgi:AcrR family transcriptional regulator
MSERRMAKAGRPRNFDRNAALSCAMEAFWAKGYDGVTLEDLQKVMGGLSPPSFYAAFGSKEKVFREAVALCAQSMGAPIVSALSHGKSARESVQAMLLAAVDAFTQRGRPCGCMVTTNWTACMPRHESIRDFLGELRNSRRKLIRDRLRQGVRDGDIPKGADVSSMARFYAMTLDGLSIEARDGSSPKALRSIVQGAMAAWTGFLGPGNVL